MQVMNKVPLLFFFLIFLSSASFSEERISKSERATITSFAILSMYETKCADLTDFGYEMFIKIVKDQESKGRNIWVMDAYQEGYKRMSGFFGANSKSVACREIRKVINKMPIFNQMIN
jgi:hypothetical protein